MQGDWRVRLDAIERRAQCAQDAWDRGDIRTLRMLTLEDVPLLLDVVRVILRGVGRE